MKKTIGALLLSVSIFGGVFAHDCNIIEGKNLELTAQGYGVKTAYHNVLPPEAFKQALINLKSWCCTQEIRKSCSEDDIKNAQKYRPESPYLFDHLIDIAMRRLDGYKELAYGLEPDSTAAERRKKITEIANDPNGVQASTIESAFTGYRTLHKSITYDKGNVATGTVLTNYNKNIATISLIDKYDTICEIMSEIYSITYTSNGTIIGSKKESKSFLNSCRNMVTERVKRETGYIKVLMVQKSNRLFDQVTKAYTKRHFVEEKLMALWDIILKVKEAFKTIVLQAPASQTCN